MVWFFEKDKQNLEDIYIINKIEAEFQLFQGILNNIMVVAKTRPRPTFFVPKKRLKCGHTYRPGAGRLLYQILFFFVLIDYY